MVICDRRVGNKSPVSGCIYVCVYECACAGEGDKEELHCIPLTARIDQHSAHIVVYCWIYKTVMFDLQASTGCQHNLFVVEFT